MTIIPSLGGIERDVAGINARAGHGIARDAEKKSRRRAFNEVLVQVQLPLQVIIGGRGKTRFNPGNEKRQRAGTVGPGPAYLDNIAWHTPSWP